MDGVGIIVFAFAMVDSPGLQLESTTYAYIKYAYLILFVFCRLAEHFYSIA